MRKTLPILLVSVSIAATAQTASTPHATHAESASDRQGKATTGSENTGTAPGWGFTTLYNFCPQIDCIDGVNPYGGLIQDTAGNLYGTTRNGGDYAGGTVFKLDISGNESVLYSFGTFPYFVNGLWPVAALIQDGEGNLYGTTAAGGAYGYADNGQGTDRYGTVFKIDPADNFSILYNFGSIPGPSDGSNPSAALIQDAAGNFYGTTASSVFKIDPAGNFTVLHKFCSVADCRDGEFSAAPLIRDPAGNLYGTTAYGGAYGLGAVFKIDPAGNFSDIYNFGSTASDGFAPFAGVIQDAAGNLYGATASGGTGIDSQGFYAGTVFKLDNLGNLTVLYDFCSLANCADGENPQAALIRDAAGNLYGTTANGGVHGGGTVFKIDPAGNFSVLHKFCPRANCADGASPVASLFQDAAGNLYGTTSGSGEYGGGTVFKLTSPTPVILWPNPVSVTYGTPLSAAQLDAEALIPDTSTEIAGSFTYSPDAGTVLPAGQQTLHVTFTPTNSSHYTTATAAAQLTVTEALLTVQPTANSANLTYGYGESTEPRIGYSITGFVNGDRASVVSGSPTVAFAWPSQPNTGTYSITVGLGTLSATNYTFTTVNGSVIVTPSTLVIHPAGVSRKYGEPIPTLPYTATGLAYGQTLAQVLNQPPTLSTTAQPQPAVGSYPITARLTGVSAGQNYTLATPTTATFTVTPALLNARALNVTLHPGEPIPALNYRLTGFVYSDTSAVVSGQATLTTTATQGSAPGTYPITFSTEGLTAQNYTIDYIPATLTILSK